MPDRLLPLWARTLLRILRMALYSLTALAGLAAIAWPPASITGQVGLHVAQGSGVMCLVASLVCLISQVLHRWMWEWVAVWWVGAAIAAYATTVWILAASTPERVQQASAVTALCLTLLIRGVDLHVFAHHQPRRRGHRSRGVRQ